MSSPLNILLVRPWTTGTERLRTSLRASGLTVRITRVDFAAALYAALSWGEFDVVLYDPATPGVTPDELTAALRERCPTTPVIDLAKSDDIGAQVAALMLARRN